MFNRSLGNSFHLDVSFLTFLHLQRDWLDQLDIGILLHMKVFLLVIKFGQDITGLSNTLSGTVAI